MTNSERAARAVYHLVAEIEQLESQGDRFGPAKYTERVAAIIRREIPGVDDLDALRRRVAVLEGLLRELRDATRRYMAEQVGPEWATPDDPPTLTERIDAALSASPPAPPLDLSRAHEVVASWPEWKRVMADHVLKPTDPPAPPDPNADKVTCRRCGIKVDASECVGESADPDSEPVCYGCQFTLLIDERDRFQRLAKFYDAQIRENVAKTIVEREPDGSPCWAGRAPTLHLIRVCDEHVKFAEIVRRLKAWHDKRKGTSLHRMAYYPHLIKRYDELEQIIADAAALRAGAGGKP